VRALGSTPNSRAACCTSGPNSGSDSRQAVSSTRLARAHVGGGPADDRRTGGAGRGDAAAPRTSAVADTTTIVDRAGLGRAIARCYESGNSAGQSMRRQDNPGKHGHTTRDSEGGRMPTCASRLAYRPNGIGPRPTGSPIGDFASTPSSREQSTRDIWLPAQANHCG
jgi:hypothetical protein